MTNQPDTILCPWCGAEMEIKVVWRRIDAKGKRVWNAWASCTNDDCAAEGPFALEKETEQEAYAEAIAAVSRRYTPQWIEVKDKLPEADGKYIVCTTKGSVYCTRFKVYNGGGAFMTDMNTHIAYWMPMPDRPIDEKRGATE